MVFSWAVKGLKVSSKEAGRLEADA